MKTGDLVIASPAIEGEIKDKQFVKKGLPSNIRWTVKTVKKDKALCVCEISNNVYEKEFFLTDLQVV